MFVYENVNWFGSEVLHVDDPYLYNLLEYHAIESPHMGLLRFPWQWNHVGEVSVAH
jgi:hypothetical protein